MKRRTDAAGIVPDEDAIARLVVAILMAQNDEPPSEAPDT
ncbi:transposase [Aquibium sp. ELW1220]|nr:hypothetical protein [Aquibium sp. ELW1220]MDN2581185.1 transposase [Aquibium sp. ELW1220]